jgi:hypothetical protein
MIQNFPVLVFLQIERSFLEDDRMTAMIWQKMSLSEVKSFALFKYVEPDIHAPG